MSQLAGLRTAIRARHLAPETSVIDELTARAALGADRRTAISHEAAELVRTIRDDDEPGLMEVFLAEYGLSTEEGIALMCLAEALLRVPDADTIDDLIEDKIAPSSWSEHLGKSSSALVNASTWALMLTGRVLDDKRSKGVSHVLHSAVKRLGEPVIRTAVKRAMKELGNQFVLGETIEDAVRRGMAMEEKGFTYSYDMLGEAAMTEKDAEGFFNAYRNSIELLSGRAIHGDIRQNPGISIKLSALHPRYEVGKKDRVMSELVERTLALTLLAKEANMGLNIDAEEADRLDLSLDVIEAVLSDGRLKGWDGFGVVVQAYGKRAGLVIDWLYELAQKLDRKIMVRLVKGAYWDTEIKRAQVEGLADFPVFTYKQATDVSYICCAQKLLGMTDRIYPQFATHNAHSVAAILNLATDTSSFEFQRLHGMGEALHRIVRKKHGTRCRIYAPVGAHRDLLAYLVRRLLENGANSSFVNQIVDVSVPAEKIAADPFDALAHARQTNVLPIHRPEELFAPERRNSRGWDLRNDADIALVEEARAPFRSHQWAITPLIATSCAGTPAREVRNPALPEDLVGSVVEASKQDVQAALDAAAPWDADAEERAAVLVRASDLYEENFGEFFAVLSREAGKTPADAVSEVREAVDFLRYYAAQIKNLNGRTARGLFACISPWNFPLAIFTGQIAAALAAGNGVLAKPADPTPIVAGVAVRLLHEAGVPRTALQLLPGRGSVVGAALVADPRIQGVCFTGSTATAQHINTSMAEHIAPDAPLIAETGGLNAMIVDSTALPEQAVKDIITSAFQSAGQRCSALRLLYVQKDVAETVLEMLFGAMDELALGDPWQLATDVGPVINVAARDDIAAHVEAARRDGRLLKKLDAPNAGTFIGPAVIKVGGMKDMQREIFGPVLHVATFRASDIGKIVADINASGYGLTFGLHTRIDDRVEDVTSKLNVGNIYINRNQIGAIVGSQPFGGEGMSGTGPKAGGPSYLPRFAKTDGDERRQAAVAAAEPLETGRVEAALARLGAVVREPLHTADLPGPTGESNRLSVFPRGRVLCLGPTPEAAQQQAALARKAGCPALIVCPGTEGEEAIDGYLQREDLSAITGFEAVALWSDSADLSAARKALAQRRGPLLPLITEEDDMVLRCTIERHVCIDTTASGGNATLLAAVGA